MLPEPFVAMQRNASITPRLFPEGRSADSMNDCCEVGRTTIARTAHYGIEHSGASLRALSTRPAVRRGPSAGSSREESKRPQQAVVEGLCGDLLPRSARCRATRLLEESMNPVPLTLSGTRRSSHMMAPDDSDR